MICEHLTYRTFQMQHAAPLCRPRCYQQRRQSLPACEDEKYPSSYHLMMSNQYCVWDNIPADFLWRVIRQYLWWWQGRCRGILISTDTCLSGRDDEDCQLWLLAETSGGRMVVHYGSLLAACCCLRCQLTSHVSCLSILLVFKFDERHWTYLIPPLDMGGSDERKQKEKTSISCPSLLLTSSPSLNQARAELSRSTSFYLYSPSIVSIYAWTFASNKFR